MESFYIQLKQRGQQMTDNNYVAEKLDSDTYKIFKGVYNDFKSKAIEEYKFELAPLEYEEFIDAVKKGYLECIVLKENEIPTAFLVYTTSISESVELNIVHCLGTEDEVLKTKLLIEKFMELTESDRMSKAVTYPMLGHQSVFTADISKFGFKFVGLAVLRFFTNNASSERILEGMKLSELGEGYKVSGYSDSYRKDLIKVIHESFRDSQDSLFDSRFKTIEGTTDIINKIVENIYGEFLPDVSSVLLYNDEPVGFALSNVTGGTIGNIPLVAIDKNHRGKGYSEHLLNRSIKTILDWTKLNKRYFSEVNVTTETNNYKALKLYRKVGFKEDYCYPQAYLLPKK